MKTKSIFITALLSIITAVSFRAQAQWFEQNSPTTHTLYTVSVVDYYVAWIGGDQGTVLRTTDGGAIWSNVGGGAIGTGPVYNIFGVDSLNAICTTTTNSTFIYRTTDGGTNWTQVFTMAGGFIDALWMFDSTNGFALGDPVGGVWEIYNTSDSGATWNAAPALVQNGAEAGWNNSMYVSGSRIYFGTNSSRIYYSSDSGNSWVPQTITQSNSYSICFKDTSIGLTGSDDLLNQTTDGGTMWYLNSALPGIGMICSIATYNIWWWAVRQNNKIYISSDNGNSWTTEYTAPTSGVYNAMSKSRYGYKLTAVRSGGGISAYLPCVPVELTAFTATINNSGEVVLNWQTATETNNRIFEIQRKSGSSDFSTIGLIDGAGTSTQPHSYSYVDKSITSGNYTYRLKQIDFDGHFQYSNEVNVAASDPTTFNLAQNYPNPFNPTTNISFSIPESGNVKLAVYNTIGQEVAVLVNGAVTAGQHEATFNAASLPSGAYFYKLQTANSVMVKKMLLLK